MNTTVPPPVGDDAAPAVPRRNSRFEALAPHAALAAASALVVGVGAVGRQVALQLAAMGVGRLRLLDHDVVADVNLGPQMYRPDQLDAPKVEATGRDCVALNGDVAVSWESRKVFARDARLVPAGAAVFCCVDRMDARRAVWEAAAGRCGFFGDARAAGEVVRVLAAKDPQPGDRYGLTLFSDDEAFRGACATKMTVYTACTAASLLVAQFARTLRGTLPVPDQLLDLFSVDLSEPR